MAKTIALCQYGLKFAEFYRDWVPSTEHNLSLSGGTEKLTYMLSGSFLDQ